MPPGTDLALGNEPDIDKGQVPFHRIGGRQRPAMENFARLLVRMAYWVRHPPSKRHVVVAAIVVAASMFIVAADRLGYWPDMFRQERPLQRVPDMH